MYEELSKVLLCKWGVLRQEQRPVEESWQGTLSDLTVFYCQGQLCPSCVADHEEDGDRRLV